MITNKHYFKLCRNYFKASFIIKSSKFTVLRIIILEMFEKKMYIIVGNSLQEMENRALCDIDFFLMDIDDADFLNQYIATIVLKKL